MKNNRKRYERVMKVLRFSLGFMFFLTFNVFTFYVFVFFLPFQGTARARSSTAANDVGGQGAP